MAVRSLVHVHQPDLEPQRDYAILLCTAHQITTRATPCQMGLCPGCRCVHLYAAGHYAALPAHIQTMAGVPLPGRRLHAKHQQILRAGHDKCHNRLVDHVHPDSLVVEAADHCEKVLEAVDRTLISTRWQLGG